jgi:hypothetical protein
MRRIGESCTLIDAGDLPALRRIVEKGASGQLLGTQPLVPVAQWTTIATGKRPWQHRVCHPIESITRANQAVPVTAGRRRSLALWEMLAQAGKRSLVVGWPATHGGRPENTVVVSDRYAEPTAGPGIKPWPPATPGTYWPQEIGVRLDAWRMSPEDVQVDLISLCVPEWKKVNQKRDRRLGQLRVFLATDFSHMAAMMTLLSHGQWDFAAVRFPALGAISQICLPYGLPRPPWIPEVEFGLYQNVIRGACRLLDQMLRRLVQAAGDKASVLVVSAHGVARHASPPHLDWRRRQRSGSRPRHPCRLRPRMGGDRWSLRDRRCGTDGSDVVRAAHRRRHGGACIGRGLREEAPGDVWQPGEPALIVASGRCQGLPLPSEGAGEGGRCSRGA